MTLNNHPTYTDLHGSFRKKHLLSFPFPRRLAQRALTWEFWVSLVWSISAVLMMAIATANEFYTSRVATDMDEILAIFPAFFAIVAVEGGMVFGAALKAAKEKIEKQNPVTKLKIAIAACVAISVVAGTNAVLAIVPDMSEQAVYFARVALVIALGALGSVIAWSSGEVLGAELSAVLIAREADEKLFQDKVDEWNANFQKAWTSSREYQLANLPLRQQLAAAKAATKKPKAQPQETPAPTPQQVDWRRISPEDKKWVFEHTEEEVQQRWGLISKTAGNWKKYADKMFS